MCRAGGRRCENHWTKEQRDADNKRRRTAYANKKNNTQPDVYTDEKAVNKETLISATPQENLIDDYPVYAAETIHGKVDAASLNDESYLEYGFHDPSQVQNFGQIRVALKTDVIKRARLSSEDELARLTMQERAALATFTTSNYTKINRYLHGSPRAIPLTVDEDTRPWDEALSYTSVGADETVEECKKNNPSKDLSHEVVLNQGVREWRDNVVFRNRINPHNLNGYVGTVDEAFSKADGKQRVVYRGENFKSGEGRFQAYKNSQEYVQANFALGTKVSFKGLQSATIDMSIAADYTVDGDEDDNSVGAGVLYEIRTPSGISLSEVSQFKQEAEVLIPRNTQYRVVGVHAAMMKGKPISVVQMIEVDDEDNIRTGDNLRKKDEFGDFDAHKFVAK